MPRQLAGVDEDRRYWPKLTIEVTVGVGPIESPFAIRAGDGRSQAVRVSTAADLDESS